MGVVSDGWPTQNLVASTEGNWQVYFDQTGLEIELFGPLLRIGPFHRTNCNGYTCDCQTLCRGCFGRRITSKPLVLEVDVEVKNTPSYDAATKIATFPRFTSLRFTSLFFHDIKDISGRHEQDLTRLIPTVETNIPLIVNYINSHGGWRVCGWHRRGIATDNGSGENILSSRTTGHLILLEPVNPNNLSEEFVQNLLIRFPSDDHNSADTQQAPDTQHTQHPPDTQQE